MTEPIVHAPGVRTCRPCPIESCDWHHDEDDHDVAYPPALVRPDAETLARHDGGWMGAAISATVLANYMEIERVLVEHFTAEHTPLEWVMEVVRLSEQLAAKTGPPPRTWTRPGDRVYDLGVNTEQVDRHGYRWFCEGYFQDFGSPEPAPLMLNIRHGYGDMPLPDLIDNRGPLTERLR